MKFFHSAQWQVLEERDATTDAVTTQYVWSPVYVDAMVLRDRDANASAGDGLEERLYVTHDANFNITAITDEYGTVVERYIYDPYGQATVLDANWAADADGISDFDWQHLHQGGRFDASTGLYHFRHRDYSPTLGRWVQQDPMVYVDGVSTYAALASNPILHLDAAGLSAWETLGEGGFVTVRWSSDKLGDPDRKVVSRRPAPCTVLVVLDHHYDAVKNKWTPDSQDRCNSFGMLSCWADQVNHLHDGSSYYGPRPGLIPDFPRQSGPVGIFDRPLPGYQTYMEKKIHPDTISSLGLGNSARHINSGFGMDAAGFEQVVATAWRKAIDEGKRLAKDCDKCECKEISVVFLYQSNAKFDNSLLRAINIDKKLIRSGRHVETIPCED